MRLAPLIDVELRYGILFVFFATRRALDEFIKD
jgi:hypothetical protein